MIAPRQPPTSAALLEHYRGIAPSTLGHFGDEGYLRGIRPLFDGLRMLGTVVTVKVFAPDGAILRDALLLSEPGDVLVIQCLGDQECACWGELRTLAGLIKGLAGVVVEGAVTDVAALREHRLPVFSRGVSAYTTRGIGQQGRSTGPSRWPGCGSTRGISPSVTTMGCSFSTGSGPRRCCRSCWPRRSWIASDARHSCSAWLLSAEWWICTFIRRRRLGLAPG